MTMNTDPMMTPHVTIHWTPRYIADEYGVNDERAVELLDTIAERLEERSIELGWSVIDTLINDMLREEEYYEGEEDA